MRSAVFFHRRWDSSTVEPAFKPNLLASNHSAEATLWLTETKDISYSVLTSSGVFYWYFPTRSWLPCQGLGGLGSEGSGPFQTYSLPQTLWLCGVGLYWILQEPACSPGSELVCKSLTFEVLPSAPSPWLYYFPLYHWGLIWLSPEVGKIYHSYKDEKSGLLNSCSVHRYLCVYVCCVCVVCLYIDEKRDTWRPCSYSCIFAYRQILVPRHLSISSKPFRFTGRKKIYHHSFAWKQLFQLFGEKVYINIPKVWHFKGWHFI